MTSQFQRDAYFQVLLLLSPILIPVAIFALCFPVAIVGTIANPLSPVCFAGIGILLYGFNLLIRSKWPQLRELQLTRFGVPGLPQIHRRMYLRSYRVMALGLILIASSGEF